MKRRISTAASLICLLGVIVAWGQGSRGWGITYAEPTSAITFSVVDGWAHVLFDMRIHAADGLHTLSKTEVGISQRLLEWTGARGFRCPLYALCVMFALWPATHLYLAIKARANRLPNQCSHCDYDLTGNLSGTCPECGQPAPAPDPIPPD